MVDVFFYMDFFVPKRDDSVGSGQTQNSVI